MSCDNACMQEHMAAFLRDELDPLMEKQFELQLERCETCRRKLEDSAATDQWWTETKEMLGGWEPTVDEGTSPTFDLSFLQPTDDPRMLGRLGQHEICGVIGSGGMGIVFKALDASLNRYVAIKVLASNYACSGPARKRFIREARAAAAVVHDNVISIHGVETTGAIPYLIMPYVKGESLQRRIERDGPLDVESVLRIGMQIAKGLAAAHEQGLIHRDVKPANVLLPTRIERVVLTDFGLARAVDDASLTHSGVIAGTPQYMSPEQAKGETIDPRSDLFSLGSVIYTMATGRPPFRSETPYGMIRRIVEENPRSVRDVNPQIPIWLESLINWVMEKDPNDRPESASSVATTMEKCLSEFQSGGNEIPSRLIPSRPVEDRTRPTLRRTITVFSTVFFVVLLLAAAYRFMGPNADSKSISPVSSFEPIDIRSIDHAFDGDEALLDSIENEIDQLLLESELPPEE
ncbi:MAG: protein kinase [Planctomycetota bacterium]